MAARKWTQEQRAEQSSKIQDWKPWRNSTGPATDIGKAISSRNAYHGGIRQLVRFSRWLSRSINHPETLTPEIVKAAKHRSVELCNGFTGWLSEASVKIIAHIDSPKRSN